MSQVTQTNIAANEKVTYTKETQTAQTGNDHRDCKLALKSAPYERLLFVCKICTSHEFNLRNNLFFEHYLQGSNLPVNTIYFVSFIPIFFYTSTMLKTFYVIWFWLISLLGPGTGLYFSFICVSFRIRLWDHILCFYKQINDFNLPWTVLGSRIILFVYPITQKKPLKNHCSINNNKKMMLIPIFSLTFINFKAYYDIWLKPRKGT